MREALKKVEYVTTYVNECNIYPKCPWCGGSRNYLGHRNCSRQIALERTASPQFLREQVLAILQIWEEPLKFDQLRIRLGISEDGLLVVLEDLRTQGKVESIEENEFKWSLVQSSAR